MFPLLPPQTTTPTVFDVLDSSAKTKLDRLTVYVGYAGSWTAYHHIVLQVHNFCICNVRLCACMEYYIVEFTQYIIGM